MLRARLGLMCRSVRRRLSGNSAKGSWPSRSMSSNSATIMQTKRRHMKHMIWIRWPLFRAFP